MRDPKDIGFGYGGVLRERPAPSPTQIRKIEDRVGAELPADYKAFMATQNGGAPVLNFVALADDDGYLLECLHYIDGDESDIYDVERASRRPSAGLGEQVVAVAADGSGDQLILRIVNDEWRAQWWRHDEEPSISDVAPSFSDLLNMLTAQPED